MNLSSQNAIGSPVVIAYGKHVLVPKQIFRQDSSTSDSLKYLGMLGEGPWERIVKIFIGGGGRNPSLVYDVDDLANKHPKVNVFFLPGDRNQQPLSNIFPVSKGGVAFSRTAVLGLVLDAGHGLFGDSAGTGTEPPALDIRIIAETLKVAAYDAAGVPGPRAYSTAPAWCTVDFLLSKRYGLGINPSEIEWQAWVDFQTYCDGTINDIFAQTGELKVFASYDRTPNAQEPIITYGATFTVSADIVVTAVGRQFKAGSSGIHRIRIWDDASGAVVVGDDNTEVTVGVPVVKVGRVKLSPGKTYVIGITEGTNAEASDSFTNLRAVTPSELPAEISLGQSRWSTGFVKPVTTDANGNLYDDPIIQFEIEGQTRQIKRFEMNVAISQQRDAISSLALLEQHCFFKVIERNGKFLPVSSEPKAVQSGTVWLDPDTSNPLFTFNRKNILSGSFKFDTIPTEDLPSSVLGKFRDLDDSLLTERRVRLTRPGQGRPLELDLGSMVRSQAVRVTSAFTRAIFDLRKRSFFKASPAAIGVTKLDAVMITHPDAGWENQLFDVHQVNMSSDGSLTFLCKEYNPNLYSDFDTSPLDSLLKTTLIDLSLPPPQIPAPSIALMSVIRIGPSGLNELFVQGTFTVIFPAVAARIFVDSGSGFDDTGIDAAGSFIFGPVQHGKTLNFKFVAMNSLGKRADDTAAPIVSITPKAPPGSLDPGTRLDNLVTVAQLVRFFQQNRGLLGNIGSRFGSLLGGLGSPLTWVLFAVAGLLIFKIRTLKRLIVGEVEENLTLNYGEILIDLPAASFTEGMTVWARTNYLKRKTGPAGITQNVSGSVLLQCLIFDIATDGIWADTVDNPVDLPSSPQTNELRITRLTGEIHKYDGSAWAKIGNVVAKAEKETMARKAFLALFTQETPMLTVPASAVEIHTRIEVGKDGLTTPTKRTFAISNLDLRFDENARTAPSDFQFTDDFDFLDTTNWEEVDLDASGSVSQSNGKITVDNGGTGDFAGTADTGTGWIYSLPDVDVTEGTFAANFDHDWIVTVKLGVVTGSNVVLLVFRSSNDADSECIGVRFKNGSLILFTRTTKGGSLTEDASGLSVTLNSGDFLKADFNGARLSWQYSADGQAWTDFGGPSDDIIINFPLEKCWLAAGSAAGQAQVEFDSFTISINNPIEAPAPDQDIDQSDTALIASSQDQPENLVFNPSGSLGDEGWDVSSTALIPGRFQGHEAFVMSGPATLSGQAELRAQTVRHIESSADYFVSTWISWQSANLATGDLLLEISWIDNNGLSLGTDQLSIFDQSGFVRRKSLLMTSPANTTSARLAIKAGSSGLNLDALSVLRLWSIQFEKRISEMQLDPSIPNERQNQKDGARHSLIALRKAGNLIPNGDFSQDFDNDGVPDFWQLTGNFIVDTTDTPSGRASLKFTK